MRTLHIAWSAILRIWDWFTYRPWTEDRIAAKIAWARANASYRYNWGRPVEPGPPPVSHLRHHFTFLTPEEIAERKAKEKR